MLNLNRYFQGVAYTFFCAKNSANAGALIKVLEEANQEVPPALSSLARSGGAQIRPSYKQFNKVGSKQFRGKKPMW